MSRAAWVSPDQPLPDPREAGPEGLVAVGVDLSPERLREAYGQGMFPWFNEGDPVLWWSPDPRMVLACADFKVSHSLGKKLRRIARNELLHQAVAAGANGRLPQAAETGHEVAGPAVRVTANLAFEEVAAACAGPRRGASGTWILAPMRQVYAQWHRQGYVHSVETWMDGELAGGLYGVCLGRMFFGESMFSRRTDASKIALAYLVAFLRRHGVTHIDCQQETGHLASLGARPMPRASFLELLGEAVRQPALSWGRGQLLADGLLATPARLAP